MGFRRYIREFLVAILMLSFEQKEQQEQEQQQQKEKVSQK